MASIVFCATGLLPMRTKTISTQRAMRRPRCGVSDKSVEQAENGVRWKRYALTGQKWDKNLLTYSIMNITPKVGEVRTLEAIRRAFEVWERVTPLSFEDVAFQDITNSSQDTLDIMLLFASGFHGDMSLFEGEGGSLAHAYYPWSGMGGDTHFDADEPWTLDNHDPSAYTYFYKGSRYWRFDNQKMKDDPDYPISPVWTQIQMTQLQAASGQQWTSQNHNHQLAQSRMRWTERPIRITPTMWIMNLMRRTKGWMW